jgi:hypothetical protein
VKPVILLVRMAIILLIVVGVTACQGHDTNKSLGTLDANGGGIDGSVPAGAERIYTLRGITETFEYTLRTTVTNTDLTVVIYKSENDYKNNPLNAVKTAATVTLPLFDSYPTTTYYEANFTAGLGQSGDYIVVLKAASNPVVSDQFFYDLRLMSPSVHTALSPTTTTSSVNPGQLQIFNGEAISAGTYSLSFSSAGTPTADCPQLFIYRDSSLSLRNGLLLSVVTDTTGNFVVFDFPDGKGQKRSGYVNEILLSSGATITNMLAVTPPGPYIMIKGIGAAYSYSLTLTQ